MLLIHGSARELTESAELAASVPGVHDVVLRTFLEETEAPGFPAWLSERIDRQSRASKVAITK
jgi:hypothetical protein